MHDYGNHRRPGSRGQVGRRRSGAIPFAPGLAVYSLFLAPSCSVTAPLEHAANLDPILHLAEDEGVFAYARVSPDGHFLVYASQAREHSGPPDRSQKLTVVDLRDGQVLFEEPGIDGYWSTDGTRMIFLSYATSSNRVSIWHRESGEIVRNVAPDSLGDYYSWGSRNNEDVILTIRGHYYRLEAGASVMPAAKVPDCAGIGMGQRPLLSKDASRITVFVQGTVVVRNLENCDDIFDTGLPGAKADFSWDARYIAFHAPKVSGSGYEIKIVDCVERTVRTIDGLSGSSFFPSWTKDGRLLFHYDGVDFRGFMLASDFLALPATPLGQAPAPALATTWVEIFPETSVPDEPLSIVLLWGPWSAHAPQALRALQEARHHFESVSASVHIAMAADPASRLVDLRQLIRLNAPGVLQIPLAPERLIASRAHNQNPTLLLFRKDELIDVRMGGQSIEELTRWVRLASATSDYGATSP